MRLVFYKYQGRSQNLSRMPVGEFIAGEIAHMSPDIDALRAWIGRTETVWDDVTLAQARGMIATLDRDDVAEMGDALPPGWHWMYHFQPPGKQSELGPDGHLARGGFLPPVPLPRRMWAGGALQILAPLRIGQRVQRISRIADVRMKDGRTGPLVFVGVEHEIRSSGDLAIIERQDLVYREMPRPDETPVPGQAAPGKAEWERTIVPTEVMLFRYSALTFNGHRIHYDRRYAVEVEGYPGLVVHGPFIATLLLDLLRCQCPEAVVRNFKFRAVRPIFDIAPFTVHGSRQVDGNVQLWACTPEGHLAMDASATLD